MSQALIKIIDISCIDLIHTGIIELQCCRRQSQVFKKLSTRQVAYDNLAADIEPEHSVT